MLGSVTENRVGQVTPTTIILLHSFSNNISNLSLSVGLFWPNPDKSEACIFDISSRVQSLKITVDGASIILSVTSIASAPQSTYYWRWTAHKKHLQDLVLSYTRFSTHGSFDCKCRALCHCRLQTVLLQCASSRHVWIKFWQNTTCPELPGTGGDMCTSLRPHHASP